jgi:cytochrome b subunit of formate dehydrogenase
MGKYYYAVMWMAIGIISSVDIYWAIANQDMMMELEENPIGRYLIGVDDGSIALFMSVKVAGTIIALGSLVFLYHWKQKYAWPIIITITLAQFFLLSYLNDGYIVKNKTPEEHFKCQSTTTNVKPVSTTSQKSSQ